MSTFRLKIISPAGTALDADVTSAILPTEAGEVEILAGHCKYVGLLAEGTLKYKGVQSSEFKVSSGSVAYEDGVLRVLTESIN